MEHEHDGHGRSGDGHGDWNSAWHYTEEFWDERYRSAERLWSGQPNPQLVTQVSDLPPGEALEAGCGEGADAIWLAARGWTVTGVDVSGVALERAADHAADHAAALGPELVSRLTWQRRDLLEWTPEPVGRPDEPGLFPTARAMAASLVDQHGFDQNRGTGRWAVGVASAFSRAATDLDGQPTTVKDTVLRMQRLR
jgi:SAM-dependent methyltransferase